MYLVYLNPKNKKKEQAEKAVKVTLVIKFIWHERKVYVFLLL